MTAAGMARTRIPGARRRLGRGRPRRSQPTKRIPAPMRASARRRPNLGPATIMNLPPSLHPQVPTRPEEEERRHHPQPEEEQEPGKVHGAEVNRSTRLGRDPLVEDETEEVDQGPRRRETEGPPEDVR